MWLTILAAGVWTVCVSIVTVSVVVLLRIRIIVTTCIIERWPITSILLGLLAVVRGTAHLRESVVLIVARVLTILAIGSTACLSMVAKVVTLVVTLALTGGRLSGCRSRGRVSTVQCLAGASEAIVRSVASRILRSRVSCGTAKSAGTTLSSARFLRALALLMSKAAVKMRIALVIVIVRVVTRAKAT